MEQRAKYSPGASGSKVKPRKEDASPLTPRIHQLKTVDGAFQRVWSGQKLAEIRRNDRDFRIGDLLILREGWMPDLPDVDGGETEWKYTGRYIAAEVTDVASCEKWMGPGGAGFVVLSVRVLSKAAMPAA